MLDFKADGEMVGDKWYNRSVIRIALSAYMRKYPETKKVEGNIIRIGFCNSFSNKYILEAVTHYNKLIESREVR